MSQRLKNFKALAEHPYLGRDFERLNDREIQWSVEFIQANEALPTGQYSELIHRMSISDPRVRTKSRTRVWGLLLEAMTSEVAPPQKRF